jgi:hypothetical protein
VRAELLEEKAGILNWMIEGAIDWLNTQEVPEPELSRRALSSFWATGSAMGEWLEARCDVSNPDASTGATDLYHDFRQFCVDRGDKEESILNQTCSARGSPRRRSTPTRTARGARCGSASGCGLWARRRRCDRCPPPPCSATIDPDAAVIGNWRLSGQLSGEVSGRAGAALRSAVGEGERSVPEGCSDGCRIVRRTVENGDFKGLRTGG